MGRRARAHVSDVPRLLAIYSTKNALPPDEVAEWSNKTYWWECPEGPDHQWEATAATVSRSATAHGCPFCSGKRPSVTNRLDILHPDLALEWDEDANGGSPTVVAGSEKKAWWKCQHGHTWDAIIRSRTVLGSGCPKCAGVAMSKRRSTPRPGRSLQDLYPEVAAQWHPERNGARTPVDFAPQSNKLAWWRCEVGHEWEISPAGRIAKGGAGCPYCYGRFATETTSLAAQRPDIAAEWHPELNGTLTPNDVKPGTGKRAWWLCPKQHSYQSDIANRCFLDRGCPYCTGQKAGYGNDLATLAPAVAAQWHPTHNGSLTPADVTVGNHRKPWWLCPKGHEWRASISSRVRGGAGCPHCAAGWRRSKPEVSIQCELEAVLDVDVLGDEPLNTEHGTFRIDMIIPSFKVAVEYDGSRWHTTGVQRDALKAKAVEAAGWTLIRVRETPLELTRPDDLAIATVVADYHPITAQVLQRMFLRLGERSGAEPEAVVVPELAARVDWYLQGGRCVATAKAEQLAEDGLAGRSARRPSSGTPRPKPGGSLAEKSPAIAVEWHPTLNGELTAFDVANARNASAWWLCATCGAEWQATINGRVRGQRVNCPTCNRAKAGAARSRPRPGESLADLHPHLAVQWDLERNGALTPADVKSRSHNRVWWKCSTCGDLRLASVDARVAAARVACAACGVTPDTGSPA